MMKFSQAGIVFLFAFICFVLASTNDIDRARYDEGKKQFELVQQHSQSSKYGQCWLSAMVTIEHGCRQLTDTVQAHLALSYLNCFLQIQGRTVYPCSEGLNVVTCVQGMSDGDRGSFSTFFVHTQNICYFLQAQIWQESTENTIDRLEASSSQVVEQLEFSHKVQQDILIIQNLSLQKQEKLMNQTQNLTDFINISSMSLISLFEDLKKATMEQHHIIEIISDQLTKLQAVVFGEISGFYSFFFYILAIITSYVLTAASRTSGARFWLFLIMTINVILEQTVMRWISHSSYLFDEHDTGQEALYWLQSYCRQIAVFLSLLVLGLCSYMYQDFNAVNNKLLVEIRKQNSDLIGLVRGQLKKVFSQNKNDDNNRQLESSSESADSDYTSDSNREDVSDAESDKTFLVPESHGNTETGSTMTVQNDDLSSTDHKSLTKELNDIRELQLETVSRSQNVLSWLNRLYSSGNKKVEMNTQPQPGSSPYNLRPRRSGQGLNSSPITKVESPKSFGKTVRQMQQLTEKNSRLFRAMQEQNQQTHDSGSVFGNGSVFQQ